MQQTELKEHVMSAQGDNASEALNFSAMKKLSTIKQMHIKFQSNSLIYGLRINSCEKGGLLPYCQKTFEQNK